MKLTAAILKKIYSEDKKSVFEVSRILNCSENKINYWLRKYKIAKRSIGEAIYLKKNPDGDPFKIKINLTKKEEKLLGLGLGLYWGEGHKKNKVSIRLGNTDPGLIRSFIDFLVIICGVEKENIGFNLLIFGDIDPVEAKKFWINELGINQSQIRGKITTIKSGSIGTYRQKSKYGVLILQYHNKKLRDIVCGMIDNLK